MAEKDLKKSEGTSISKKSQNSGAEDRREFIKRVASISIATAFVGAVPLAASAQEKKGVKKGRGKFSTVDPNEKEKGATDLGDLENFWNAISDNDEQILVKHMRTVENALTKDEKLWGKAERNFGQVVRQLGIKTIPDSVIEKVKFRGVPKSIKDAVAAKKKGYHWHSHYNHSRNYTTHDNYGDHSNTW